MVLKIPWSDAGVLGDTSKHSRADFLAIVKREDNVGPSFARQCAVRPGLPLELPPNTK